MEASTEGKAENEEKKRVALDTKISDGVSNKCSSKPIGDWKTKEEVKPDLSACEPAADNDTCIHLVQMCQSLGLPASLSLKAQQLWKDKAPLLKSDQWEEWLPCVVYTVLMNDRFPYGMAAPDVQSGLLSDPYCTISDLVQYAGTKLVDFFNKLREFQEVVQPSEAALQYRVILQKKYCISSYLFNKLNKIYLTVFKQPENQECGGSFEESNQKKFIWSLFLIAKGTLLENRSELMTAFNILLCCILYVIEQTPVFLLHSPYSDMKVDKGCDLLILNTLCEQVATSKIDARAVYTSYMRPLVDSLPHSAGCVDVEKLAQMYMDSHRKQGDINEMLFLESKSHLFSEKDQTGETDKCLKDNMKKFFASVDHADPSVGLTPVRAACSTVQCLRNFLKTPNDDANVQAEPSVKLKEYFQEFQTNKNEKIESITSERLKEMKEKFEEAFSTMFGNTCRQIGQQRFNLVELLYYQLLQQLIEEKRETLAAHFMDLLTSDTFHKCLVAISLEIVLTSYESPFLGEDQSSVNSLKFPWVLSHFDIQPFDFLRVLTTIQDIRPELGTTLTNHLHLIRNQVLENCVWRKDSSLYSMMGMNQTGQSSSDKGLQNLSSQGSQRSSSQPKPAPKTPVKSRSLHTFLNQVCIHGYTRLKLLCDLMGVAKELTHATWNCMELCITRKPYLLQERHLDQIMLCSLYAVCKVTERELKFKSIVAAYKNLPHAHSKVYKEVYLRPGERYNIIQFYNEIFMQNAKEFVVQLAPKTKKTTMQSPNMKLSSPQGKISPVYTLAGRRNFYISNLQESPFKVTSPGQMTPRSKQLYSFGEVLGSAEKIKNINEVLKRHQSPPYRKPSESCVPSRKRKQLNFDSCGDGHTSSDEPCPVDIIKVRKTVPPVTKQQRVNTT